MAQLSATDLDRQFQYPQTMHVYGIIVDDRLSSALIKVGLNALRQRPVDRLIFLCLDPHDVRSRTDWDDILAHIPATDNRRPEIDIKIVRSPEELLYASLNMRIVRLPDDTVFI